MIDSSQLDADQWKWLAEELQNSVAVSVLVSAKSLGGSEREKFISLVKKSKQKNIVLLTTQNDQSKISKTSAAMATIYEISPRSSGTDSAIVGDAPMQIAKPADFGMLKFDWSKRMAVFEIRNSQDEKVETLEASF